MIRTVYQIVEPGKLELLVEECKPRSQEYLIRTVYTAISPGTELAAYSGMPPLRPSHKVYPRLVGYCNIGQIEKVPEEFGINNQYTVGDYVLTQQCHCSHATVVNSGILACLSKADEVNDDHLISASTTYLFHLGYNVSLRTSIMSGMKVAVIGMGTLGLTTAATARLNGAQIDGYSNHAKQNAALKQYGFSKVFRKDEHLSKDKYDVVVITTNSWDDWKLALDLARRGGQIAVLSFPGRGEEAPDFNPLDSKYFYDKQLSIHSCGYTPNLDVPTIDCRFSLKRNCEHLLSEIMSNRLPGRSLIDRVEPASMLPNIYADMLKSRSSGQTTCLDWR